MQKEEDANITPGSVNWIQDFLFTVSFTLLVTLRIQDVLVVDLDHLPVLKMLIIGNRFLEQLQHQLQQQHVVQQQNQQPLLFLQKLMIPMILRMEDQISITIIIMMRVLQIQQEIQILMQAALVAQWLTILKMGLQMLILNPEQEALKAHPILALVREELTIKGNHQAQREEREHQSRKLP